MPFQLLGSGFQHANETIIHWHKSPSADNRTRGLRSREHLSHHGDLRPIPSHPTLDAGHHTHLPPSSGKIFSGSLPGIASNTPAKIITFRLPSVGRVRVYPCSPQLRNCEHQPFFLAHENYLSPLRPLWPVDFPFPSRLPRYPPVRGSAEGFVGSTGLRPATWHGRPARGRE